MSVKSITLAAAAAMWAAFSFPAEAQMVCTTRTELVKMLSEKYGEQRIGYGLAGGLITEVFVSEKGSFTLVISRPDGISCIGGAGQDWQFETLKKGTGL